MTPEGKTREWRNATIPAYQRRTKRADALIAGTYLSGTSMCRGGRARSALFGGAVGKDTVSRVWRKTKGDWDVWNARSLADEPVVRLILDGTVVRVRLDKKATSISLLVALGVRSDGQKVLLAIKNMGGQKRSGRAGLAGQPGLARHEDAGTRHRRRRFRPGQGVGGALARCASLASARCTSTVISSLTRLTGCTRRSRPTTTTTIHAEYLPGDRGQTKSLHSKMAGKNAAPSPTAWKKQATDCSLSRASRSANGSRTRTTNAIERLHEELKRRIKTQTVLPGAETAAMLFWALLASGQIVMRKVGWRAVGRP